MRTLLPTCLFLLCSALNPEASGQEVQTIGFWGLPSGDADSLYAPVGVDLHPGGVEHALFGGPITKNNSYLFAEAVRLQDGGTPKPWFFIACVDLFAASPSSNGFVPMINQESAIVLSMQHHDKWPDNPSSLGAFSYRLLSRLDKDDCLATYEKAVPGSREKTSQAIKAGGNQPELIFKTFEKPEITQPQSIGDSTWTKLTLPERDDLAWYHYKLTDSEKQPKGAITVVIWKGGPPIGLDNIQMVQ